VSVSSDGSAAQGAYVGSQSPAALQRQTEQDAQRRANEETRGRDARERFKARFVGGSPPQPEAPAPQPKPQRSSRNQGPSDTPVQGAGSSQRARGTYTDVPLPDPDALARQASKRDADAAYAARQEKLGRASALANELTAGEHFPTTKGRLLAALEKNDYRVRELAQLALEAGELTQREYDTVIASHAQRSKPASKRERRR
jgi:hypothetical protein